MKKVDTLFLISVFLVSYSVFADDVASSDTTYNGTGYSCADADAIATDSQNDVQTCQQSQMSAQSCCNNGSSCNSTLVGAAGTVQIS